MNERVASLVGDLPPVGTKVVYRNNDPSSMWHDMDGVRGTVLRHRTEVDDDHDEECLPMLLLELDTSQGHGRYFEVWPDEITVDDQA